MNFIGQASQYSFGRSFRHLFAWGTAKDSHRLRQTLAEHYHAKKEDVALYHSGRSALAQAISAVLPAGSAVIVPGLTCIAVIRAIRAAKCEPVYVDIDPETLQYSVADLERKLSDLQESRRVSSHDVVADSVQVGESKDAIDKNNNLCYNGGIIAQNTLGLPLDMSRIEQLASKYNLQIIEDLAHCAGRFYPDGREIGTVGAAVALSFGKGKAIDTVCGGAVIIRDRQSMKGSTSITQSTKHPSLSQRLRDRWYPIFAGVSRLLWPVGLGKPFLAALVRMHWIERSADTQLDLTVRLTHWQSRLALRQLRSLPRTPLRDFSLVRDRDKVLQKLERAGYAWSDIWYDTPVAPARYAEEANFPAATCPDTIRVSKHIVNIPTWYRPEKIARARAIIDQNLLRGEDD